AGREHDLDETARHGDDLGSLVREAELAGAVRRKAQEVGAEPCLRVVEQWEGLPVGPPARLVPAGQAVAGSDLASQQLVEGDVQSRGQVEQGLEREPPLASLR